MALQHHHSLATMLYKLIVTILAGFCVTALSGCSTFHYYSQATAGQMALLQQRIPIAAVIADPATPAELRDALLQVEAIREFAADALALPVDGTYSSYVELDREAVVWNLLVARVDSLELKSWCYPLVGCQSYRGYFSRQRAEQAAAAYDPEHWDSWIAGVPAYSTLGWFDDPALSTFIHWPQGQLAALLFHELSHKVVYVKGNTAFNESYATAVELEGLLRYLSVSEQAGDIPQALARHESEREFTGIVMATASQLQQLYREPELSRGALLREKRRLLEALRTHYHQQRRDWVNPDAYRAFFDDGLNNARIASVGTYNRWVPAFRQLLAQKNGNFAAFHCAVRELARLPEPHRTRRLEKLESAGREERDGQSSPDIGPL